MTTIPRMKPTKQLTNFRHLNTSRGSGAFKLYLA